MSTEGFIMLRDETNGRIIVLDSNPRQVYNFAFPRDGSRLASLTERRKVYEVCGDGSKVGLMATATEKRS